MKHYLVRMSERTYIIVREQSLTPAEHNLDMALGKPIRSSVMFETYRADQITKKLSYSEAMKCLALLHVGEKIPERLVNTV